VPWILHRQTRLKPGDVGVASRISREHPGSPSWWEVSGPSQPQLGELPWRPPIPHVGFVYTRPIRNLPEHSMVCVTKTVKVAALTPESVDDLDIAL
jgi:hypothetical protein